MTDFRAWNDTPDIEAFYAEKQKIQPPVPTEVLQAVYRLQYEAADLLRACTENDGSYAGLALIPRQGKIDQATRAVRRAIAMWHPEWLTTVNR